MNRVLVIDKATGPTSHDIVARVRRASREKKVGHAGTLDPGATGVLVVLVGKATRLAQFFTDTEKEYRGRVVLGATTDSQDAQGKVLQERPVGDLTSEQIEAAFARFVGHIDQIPPMVSALKREGTPLYVLARRGVTVEREARPIEVKSLRILNIELPEVEFEITCSRGTYVRTLAADIGEQLGCGAHLGQLTRTRVGPFGIEQAMKLEEFERLGPEMSEAGHSMYDALGFLPALRVDAGEEDSLSTGGAIEVSEARLTDDSAEFVRVTTDGRELIAVGRPLRDDPDLGEGTVRIQPVRVFVELL